MDIFSVFTLLGGLAFFLFGMSVMSASLEKMVGGKLERTLKTMTSTPLRSLLLGAGVTIAIQSSSAMTVMLVGLVNSGIMELSQTVGVIMGSNIGTTLTAWILSLAGIESSNFFLRILKPESFAPLIALVGVVMMMVAKSQKKKDMGNIFVGFAVLMYGMELMGDAVAPLADMPQFASILTAFENPLLGVLVGTVFTGIIQSSAASVGILQALSMTGGVTYGMAIPIIMGQNIGTCVTSVLSSIGVNKNAKRVAAVHVSFNVIGTILFLIVYFGLDALVGLPFTNESISPVGIAFVHSIFNIATTLVLLPFPKVLVKIANVVIRDAHDEKEALAFIDERLLATPSFAIAECRNKTVEMGKLAQKSVLAAIHMALSYEEKTAQKILKREQILDEYEDKIGLYLVKLASKPLSDLDSAEISKLLHTIGDFERMGDHAVNVIETAKEMHDKEIFFSEQAVLELKVLTQALEEILRMTFDAFFANDSVLAEKVEPLEQVIDRLVVKIRARHIERLKHAKCTIELGFILGDFLGNFERISDHCSNVAFTVLETQEEEYEAHAYTSALSENAKETFQKRYHDYKMKYTI